MKVLPNSATAKKSAASAVDAVFKSYPEDVRSKLLLLRQLILDTVTATSGVGAIEETLKWGQPSYLTSATKSGSTIRIDSLKSDAGGFALYFHCQTNLVDTFRELYPAEMTFVGNRSIEFRTDDELPVASLQHCIGLALTYHRRKSGTGQRQKSRVNAER